LKDNGPEAKRKARAKIGEAGSTPRALFEKKAENKGEGFLGRGLIRQRVGELLRNMCRYIKKKGSEKHLGTRRHAREWLGLAKGARKKENSGTTRLGRKGTKGGRNLALIPKG